MKWLLIFLSACSVGSGYVGQARAHTAIDMRACNGNDCKTIETHEPDKEFWGFNLSFPTTGVAETSNGVRLRIDPSFELMRGMGRYAVGLRTSAVFDVDPTRGISHAQTGMVPIDALGHVSLTDRVSIYGGLGVVPFSRVEGTTSFLGGRVVGGVQFGLSRDFLQRYTVLTLEADSTWIDTSYRSTGLTSNFGIYF